MANPKKNTPGEELAVAEEQAGTAPTHVVPEELNVANRRLLNHQIPQRVKGHDLEKPILFVAQWKDAVVNLYATRFNSEGVPVSKETIPVAFINHKYEATNSEIAQALRESEAFGGTHPKFDNATPGGQHIWEGAPPQWWIQKMKLDKEGLTRDPDAYEKSTDFNE